MNQQHTNRLLFSLNAPSCRGTGSLTRDEVGVKDLTLEAFKVKNSVVPRVLNHDPIFGLGRVIRFPGFGFVDRWLV